MFKHHVRWSAHGTDDRQQLKLPLYLKRETEKVINEDLTNPILQDSLRPPMEHWLEVVRVALEHALPHVLSVAGHFIAGREDSYGRSLHVESADSYIFEQRRGLACTAICYRYAVVLKDDLNNMAHRDVSAKMQISMSDHKS